MTSIKDHISLLLTVIALVTAMFTFDARYVHAETNKKEIASLNAKLDQSIQLTQQTIQRSSSTLRRQILEDKVFEIEAKQAQKTATPVDAALKARYLRQIQESVNEKTL